MRAQIVRDERDAAPGARRQRARDPLEQQLERLRAKRERTRSAQAQRLLDEAIERLEREVEAMWRR